MFAYPASWDEPFLGSGRGILGQACAFHKLRGYYLHVHKPPFDIGSLPPSAKLMFTSSKSVSR